MKEITQSKINEIIHYIQQGVTAREIAKLANVGLATVSKYRHLSHVKASVNIAGRKKIFTKAKQRLISRGILKETYKSVMNAFNDLSADGYNVNYTAVVNCLHNIGFIKAPKAKKPLISKANMVKRLEFAHKHSNWTVDDWNKVIFSDETQVSFMGFSGYKYHWILPGTSNKFSYIDPQLQQKGGHTMIWACITSKGVGEWAEIQGNLTAKDYINILEDSLKTTIRMKKFKKKKIYFQQDNPTPHVALITKEYLKKEKYNLLTWPPQSPDLNPIENVWHTMKIKLGDYNSKANGVHDCLERVKTVWASITDESLAAYYNSMPSRIQAVIQANGGVTKF